MEIADQDIGGARIRMTFTRGNMRMKPGEHMTADEVRSIPLSNRRALTSAGYIEVYPARTEVVQKAAYTKPMDRFVVQVKKDHFNVIEGYRLNDQPLDRTAAEALASAK
jgi:hypothetical protein